MRLAIALYIASFAAAHASTVTSGYLWTSDDGQLELFVGIQPDESFRELANERIRFLHAAFDTQNTSSSFSRLIYPTDYDSVDGNVTDQGFNSTAFRASTFDPFVTSEGVRCERRQREWLTVFFDLTGVMRIRSRAEFFLGEPTQIRTASTIRACAHAAPAQVMQGSRVVSGEWVSVGNAPPPSAVPLPASGMLLVGGLAAIFGSLRRLKIKS